MENFDGDKIIGDSEEFWYSIQTMKYNNCNSFKESAIKDRRDALWGRSGHSSVILNFD